MIRYFRFSMTVALFVCVVATTSSCSKQSAFGLASIEEEALMLSALEHSNMRFAVLVTEDIFERFLAADSLGNLVGPLIAQISREKLGVETIVLDHAPGGEWANELERLKVEDRPSYGNFVRSQEFDRYIHISLDFEPLDPWQFRERSPMRVTQAAWIYSNSHDGKETRLMAQGSSPNDPLFCRVIITDDHLRQLE